MTVQEEIIKRNPQVIIIPEENGITLDSLKKRSGWTSIDAVKNNRIIFVDASLSSGRKFQTKSSAQWMELILNMGLDTANIVALLVATVLLFAVSLSTEF